MSDLPWQARLQEAKEAELYQGYTDSFACLYCDAQHGNAQQAAAHLKAQHISALTALLALPKQFTGLTDRQKTLLSYWQGGATDAQIAQQLGNSTSTIRNQRFQLREHERQARLFLAALKLAGVIEPRPRRQPQDPVDRFFEGGRLKQLPAKMGLRLAVLKRIAALFAPHEQYTEKQVRELLTPVFEDHAVLRRYLVDASLLARKPDGSIYWRLEDEVELTEGGYPMPIDKKAAKQAYKNTIPPMGVYRILDQQTGRYVVASDRNLDSVTGRFNFVMESAGIQPGGPYSDPQMFEDYRDHGAEFVIEVLAKVDIAKCATYQEAVDQLEPLYKTIKAQHQGGQSYKTK